MCLYFYNYIYWKPRVFTTWLATPQGLFSFSPFHNSLLLPWETWLPRSLIDFTMCNHFSLCTTTHSFAWTPSPPISGYYTTFQAALSAFHTQVLSIADHPSAEVPSTASQMLLILHMGPPTWWSSSPPHPAGALVSHQSSCPHPAWSLTPCAEQASYMDGLIPSLGLWLPFWVTVALSLFCWHGCLSCLVPPPSFWTNLFRKRRKEGKNRMIL